MDYMEEARLKVEQYLEQKRLREKQAMDKYEKESRERAKANGLVSRLGPDGAIDTIYFDELPLEVGYHVTPDGVILEYVALGGMEVTDVLPPDVLEDIKQRIADYEINS
jgi:hypothetical protein